MVPPVRRGTARMLLVLLLALVAAGLLSLALGSRALPLGTVVDVLFHDDGSEAATIVRTLRIPRTVLAISVGVSLGVAGALMQGPHQESAAAGVHGGCSFIRRLIESVRKA